MGCYLCLINILGGMDIVLQNYLNINHIHGLNSHQLNEINNILLSIMNNQVKNTQYNSCGIDPILYVSSNDTWFHNIFKISTASKNFTRFSFIHYNKNICNIIYIMCNFFNSWYFS